MTCFNCSHLAYNKSYRSAQEESTRTDVLSEEIGMMQNLRNTFFPILNVVLSALEAPPVFMRTKALKALGQIITSDPSILSAVSTVQYKLVSDGALIPPL